MHRNYTFELIKVLRKLHIESFAAIFILILKATIVLNSVNQAIRDGGVHSVNRLSSQTKNPGKPLKVFQLNRFRSDCVLANYSDADTDTNAAYCGL